MWLRRFRWLITIGLCSGEGTRSRLRLTQRRKAWYGLNFGKELLIRHKCWIWGSLDHFQKRSGADSWIEIHQRSVFRCETTGIPGIAE